jgi:glucose-1-phosphate adenylyltransferase
MMTADQAKVFAIVLAVHPVFNLCNMEWPILTPPDPLPPAKFIFEDEGRTGHALDLELDGERLAVSAGGVVVVPKSVHILAGAPA